MYLLCCYPVVPKKEVKTQGELITGQTTIRIWKKWGKNCQEWFCRHICIKWKILELASRYETVYLATSAWSTCKNVSWGWCWSIASNSWTWLGWSAGCSSVCNSMMHHIVEFVLGWSDPCGSLQEGYIYHESGRCSQDKEPAPKSMNLDLPPCWKNFFLTQYLNFPLILPRGSTNIRNIEIIDFLFFWFVKVWTELRLEWWVMTTECIRCLSSFFTQYIQVSHIVFRFFQMTFSQLIQRRHCCILLLYFCWRLCSGMPHKHTDLPVQQLMIKQLFSAAHGLFKSLQTAKTNKKIYQIAVIVFISLIDYLN